MAERDPQEEIGTDESNLNSSVAASKRQPATFFSRSSQASLQRCSTLSFSTSQIQCHHSDTSLRRHPSPPLPSFHPSSPPETSYRHRIPGPAGTLQSAMERRKNKHLGQLNSSDEEPVPTQEYIRRVVQGDGAQDDEFFCNPWLSTVEFVRGQGLLDANGSIGTPLAAIKSKMPCDKINQVVAIIKSCTPNVFGDMMVTLKDPTGTIDSTVHHTVFSEGEFGKSVTVGAVIILQKVTVFSPSRTSHYLNITRRNVVKVISKNEDIMRSDFPVSNRRLSLEASGHNQASETVSVTHANVASRASQKEMTAEAPNASRCRSNEEKARKQASPATRDRAGNSEAAAALEGAERGGVMSDILQKMGKRPRLCTN